MKKKQKQKSIGPRIIVVTIIFLVFLYVYSLSDNTSDSLFGNKDNNRSPLNDYINNWTNRTENTYRPQADTDPLLTTKPTTTKSPQTTKAPETTRKPQTTKAPETTRKPQTTAPLPDNIPSEFKDHVFLDAMNKGRCDELVGNVLVTVIFVNDSESSWTSSEISEQKNEFVKQGQKLESAAAKYNKKLDISFSYINASYSGTIYSGDTPTQWQNPVCQIIGFSSISQAQIELDKSNDYDANPLVFFIDKPGRPYAYTNSYCERMSLFDDAGSFTHELCHIFGAPDLYFPKDVETLALQYVPNSVMGSGDSIDAFTAFCIGWDEELDNNAYNFLKSTTYVTHSYLNTESAKQQYTGYVTNYDITSGVYTGYLDRGVMSGNGTVKWSDGTYYEGDFVNGTYHGKGTIKWPGGAVYTGDFVKGSYHGQGTLKWPNGVVYTGDFMEGKYHGKGTCTYPDGSYYTGDWVKGWMTGKGTNVWGDGSYYIGDWVNNQRVGYGTMVWTDGSSYEGYWQNDQRHGYGKFINQYGTVFEGNWKNDQFQS